MQTFEISALICCCNATYTRDVKPKFKILKNISILSKAVRYVISKNFAFRILCLALLEQKLHRFESLFWSLL